MYNQLYSKCNSSSSRQCFNRIRTLREEFSASCGNRFRCLRKPIPQCTCAGSVPAACGNLSRSMREAFPHAAGTLPARCASAVCGNRFRWLRSLSRGMRELFPQAADTIPAVCGPAAECTSRPPYVRLCSESEGIRFRIVPNRIASMGHRRFHPMIWGPWDPLVWRIPPRGRSARPDYM